MINLQHEQIKPLRKILGISHIDLEILTGIYRTRISDIERLKREPEPHEIQLIAEALNRIGKIIPKKEIKLITPKIRVKCYCGRTASVKGLGTTCYIKLWSKNNREKINKYQRERYHRLKNEKF